MDREMLCWHAQIKHGACMLVQMAQMTYLKQQIGSALCRQPLMPVVDQTPNIEEVT